MLERLRQQVDTFFARALAAQPDEFACHAGCQRCCHADLVVFGIEADRVAAALAGLPTATREAAARRAEQGTHCALLSPRTGRCLVYEERPLICRAFGLATLFEGVVTWCPLNFADHPPRREFVLKLGEVNRELRGLELRANPRERHVRISEIALQDQ
ncbi:MAG: YkgJ family cysteine cluster protein [Myxococcales bacterium]